MLRVKGLNTVLIVMLMCSEIGEIITPSGTERWRNGGEEPSDPRREGSGRGILMSAPEINKEISDLSVTCLQYPLCQQWQQLSGSVRTQTGESHIIWQEPTRMPCGLKSELSQGLISSCQPLINNLIASSDMIVSKSETFPSLFLRQTLCFWILMSAIGDFWV